MLCPVPPYPQLMAADWTLTGDCVCPSGATCSSQTNACSTEGGLDHFPPSCLPCNCSLAAPAPMVFEVTTPLPRQKVYYNEPVLISYKLSSR